MCCRLNGSEYDTNVYSSGLVVKQETNVCGHLAFSTQVEGLTIVYGTGVPTLSPILEQHVSPVNELFTAIGHAFVVNQVN